MHEGIAEYIAIEVGKAIKNKMALSREKEYEKVDISRYKKITQITEEESYGVGFRFVNEIVERYESKEENKAMNVIDLIIQNIPQEEEFFNLGLYLERLKGV